jgi:hypothetical protein
MGNSYYPCFLFLFFLSERFLGSMSEYVLPLFFFLSLFSRLSLTQVKPVMGKSSYN